MSGFNIHVYECAGPPTIPPTHVGQHWVDTVNGDHYLANGTSSINDWILIPADHDEQIFEITVSALSTVALHTAALTSFCSKDYTICMFNVANDVWRSLRLRGGRKTSTTVEDTVYGIIGSAIDVDLDFKVVAADAVLEAINNEIFPVTIRLRIETI
jgi:hypothetical protein